MLRFPRAAERMPVFVTAVCSTFRRNLLEGDGGLARPDAPEMLCRDAACPIHGATETGATVAAAVWATERAAFAALPPWVLVEGYRPYAFMVPEIGQYFYDPASGVVRQCGLSKRGERLVCAAETQRFVVLTWAEDE